MFWQGETAYCVTQLFLCMLLNIYDIFCCSSIDNSNILISFYLGAIFSLMHIKPFTFSYAPNNFYVGELPLTVLISLTGCSLNLHCITQKGGPGGWNELESVSVGALGTVPLCIRKYLMQFKFCVSFVQAEHLCSWRTIAAPSPRYM